MMGEKMLRLSTLVIAALLSAGSLAQEGHPDPLVGKGALDPKEAAALGELAGTYRIPHFRDTPADSAEQWARIASFDIPEWLLDAKFGVYTHWGPGNVTEFAAAGNYIRGMYNKNDAKGIYEYHQENYGGFTEVGYSDIMAMFTAEAYEPKAYVDLMLESGAKFGGLGLVHHDGYLMWDSEVSRWNAMDVGPKRDLFGDFVEEARKANFRVVGSFHHARSYDYTKRFLDLDTFTEEEKQKADLFQEEFADLFYNSDFFPEERFAREWHAKIVEVVDKYQPDFLWFDGVQLGTRHTPAATAASALLHFFESSAERGQEVGMCNKLPAGNPETLQAFFSFPEGTGIRCYEGGRDMPADNAGYFLFDRAIAHPWGYVKNKKYRWGTNYHVDGLIDVVARGGILLLSLAPMANGEIPPEEVEIMRGIGAWLEINGEAIYGTRRWHIPGEDHNDAVSWGYKPDKKLLYWPYTGVGAAQIRFTQAKDGTLYAIALGRPESGEVRVRNLHAGSEYFKGDIEKVSLLGHEGELEFSRRDDALVITFPESATKAHAYAFRIE
jgi:alpha-L-fucosidase